MNPKHKRGTHSLTGGATLATSRTGTTVWKRVRTYALKEAQRNGQTKCPFCQVTLDYERGRESNSAWVDHIVPHNKGGQDSLANALVCCRTCNISKGDREAPKPKQVHSLPFISSRW
jgi:5-methylcytosine-specific restriction endonuclease McrA